MTLAICIVCGSQKFGAFVPCQECGFEPTDLADKAKSLMLSDHNLPPGELQKYSETIKSHEDIPYDFIVLAALARPITEEAYYWEHLDAVSGSLRCIRCGGQFRPDGDEVFCSLCCAQIEERLSICSKCQFIFDSGAKYCQKCGTALTVSSGITVRSLATDIEIGLRRILATKNPLAKSNVLAEAGSKLSENERRASKQELEIVAMHCALLVLSEFVPSSSLRNRIKLEMVSLYRESFVLSGARSEDADPIHDHCLRRLDEFTVVMARDPEQWNLRLGDEAARNCFKIEKHIGATTEMMVVIRFFMEVLQGGVIDSLIRREVKQSQS
jgi:hypothetical protein